MNVRAQIEHLPQHPTNFIGREDEIAHVMEMLADSHCRLLTLTGEGGIGKSRLAVEIAARSSGYHPDGIYGVDLQAVYTTAALIQVIADALGCPLSGHQPPFEQLRHFLRNQDMLVLLDNFEQLLPEGAEALVSELLNDCPGLTIVVTSRTVLNLQQEWVWRVSGLAFPTEGTAESAEQYDAVRLFAERARRVQPDFLIENDLPHVLQICRLVEGLPLALELASCWLKVLPCKAIAEEIRHNLDFLNSHQRDVPERHRSMRAVFEQCWRLLSPEEQAVMNRLSVFKGGFRRQAAERVAGATLNTLLLLTDKSLLRHDANGRFHIHELVRQHAAENLGDASALLEAHCTDVASFLHDRYDDLRGGRQLGASEEIAEELDNIRAAWAYAVKQGNYDALYQMSTPYIMFCQFRGRYQEAYDAYHSATIRLFGLPQTPEVDLPLGILLTGLGWMYIRLGQLQRAETTFQQADAAFKRLEIPPALGYGGDPALGRAVIALVRGDYGAAESLAKQGKQTAEAVDNVSCLAIACRTLAEVYLRQGKHDAAHQHASRAFQLCEAAGDQWFMAYCLTTLGELALETQAYAAARTHFEAAYTLRQEMRDPEGMALALAYLGDIALRQQTLDEARRRYEDSHALYQQINDPGGLSRALCGLSRVHLSLRNYIQASESCRHALKLTVPIQYIPVLLELLMIAGELCYTLENHSKGLEILAQVATYPAASATNRAAVQQFLTRHHIARLPALGAGRDLQDLRSLLQRVTDIEWSLLKIEDAQRAKPRSRMASSPTTSQPLPDPLSQRELEVLAHVVAGLQNREIADRLMVSLNTIKTHINNIYSKLGVNSRTQAVARAHDLKLL